MPKHHSFLVRDVPATGTRLQCGVSSAARCPTRSRRNHTVGGRTGGGANTRARPGGTSGWARRRDVTAPVRARRTHAHCAQHEGRGSDQVTRRWVPPSFSSASLQSLSAHEREVLLPLAAKRGCMCWSASPGLGGSRLKEEAGRWGYCLAGLVVLGSRSSSARRRPSAPRALKFGFMLDSHRELQKLLVSGSHSQERCFK